MPEGGCLCGDLRISHTGDPAFVGLCHCNSCRKQSGSAFSSNILVPEANFHLDHGTPKTFENIADSGNKLKGYFCETCGTTCYKDLEAYPGMKLIKGGVMDVMDMKQPQAEFYCDRRLDWMTPFEGAAQKEDPLKAKA